ncbi:MAG TPA: thioredoxin family protein [Nitrososphaerales archaeon]|nr:thioredoxin family protein [Nitrososphaerales archaeon]
MNSDAASLPALGERSPGFESLVGVDGREYSLSSFDDKQILVLVFFGTGCPTCKATEERLISIQNDYRERGVQVIMVNSNNSSISPPDTLAEMTKRSSESGYNFPYLKDEDRRLARSLGARTTPHAFVLDRERRVRYRGRVDNARQKALVTVSDVRNALDDLLSGKEVKLKETDSFGCGIVW